LISWYWVTSFSSIVCQSGLKSIIAITAFVIYTLIIGSAHSNLYCGDNHNRV
jgi:hypothetical protein